MKKTIAAIVVTIGVALAVMGFGQESHAQYDP
jgi:hypothetical protein